MLDVYSYFGKKALSCIFPSILLSLFDIQLFSNSVNQFESNLKFKPKQSCKIELTGQIQSTTDNIH